MKKKVLALMLAFAMVATVGCGGSGKGGESKTDAGKAKQETAANKGQDGLFTMSIDYMPESLQPSTGTDSFTTMIRPIYYPLYYRTGTDIEYYLADKIDISEDKLTYTVHLNEDATWSDGTPITVDDILFTINYRAFSSGGSSSLDTVDGEKVTFNKKDDKTLEAVLPHPYALYDNYLGDLLVLPSHAFEGNVEKVDNSGYFNSPDMATSGPFKVEQINADSFVYVARDDFFAGEPDVKKLVLRTLGAGSSQKVAFENGELSYMRVTTAEELEKYRGQSDKYNISSVTEARLNYLQLNPHGPLMSTLSKEARQAIMLALNGQEIVDTAYGSDELAVPANSVLTPDQHQYSKDAPGYKQDLETAKKLAKSSGLEGKTLTYIYNADRANMEAVATVIQQQLSQIGVKLSIEGLDSPTFFSRFFAVGMGTGLENTYDLGSNGWDSERGSAYQAHFYLNHGLAEKNAWGWSKEISEKVIKADATADEAEAQELWNEIQEEYVEEYWEFPLTYTNFVMVSQINVTGLDGSEVVPELVDWMSIKVD